MESVAPKHELIKPECPFGHILIFGVGLIGGSIAYALRDCFTSTVVYGVDIEAETVDRAKREGLMTDCRLLDDNIVLDWLSDPSLDLVILAVPVSATPRLFQMIEDAGYAGLITDVSSTKQVIDSYAHQILTDPSRFIPGHPMAGSEVNGLEGARPKLFNGSHWILCPDKTSDPEEFMRLHEFATGIGARAITIDRNSHDEIIAIVSHVPHIVATALMRLAGTHAEGNQELFRLAAGGFKDTTRIAAGSSQLWCGIALDNHIALANGIAELEGILSEIEQAVRHEDEKHLTSMLEESAQMRRSLPAAWIPDSSKLIEMRIPMADHTGVIADVTGVAAKAGCNIQSIDIDHINEDNAVLELILTDEGDIGQLSARLLKKGFDFSLRPLDTAGAE